MVCLCVQQTATAPTDNFALLHCTFQQGPRCSPSRRRVCSDVHLQRFTAPSELHAPPLLQPAAAPLGKSALLPTASINVARAIRFSSTTRSCNTTTLASPYYNLALLHGLTQDLLTTPPVSLQTSPFQHSSTFFTATTTTTPSSIQQRTAPFGIAAPPTNCSAAITSLCELCASFPTPETAPIH